MHHECRKRRLTALRMLFTLEHAVPLLLGLLVRMPKCQCYGVPHAFQRKACGGSQNTDLLGCAVFLHEACSRPDLILARQEAGA
jgi:hypothetical protein